MQKIKIAILYNSELIAGILLIISFISAMMIANIAPLQDMYKTLVFLPITFGYGQFTHEAPLIQLVNDGLMTLFFLLIGLELKFHLVCGEFQNKHKLILPTAAAIGGIVVPVLIYWFFNFGSPDTQKGWAIPIATDTAFMLWILSFFGKFIPTNLRAFIIGFSLIDDAIALIILAIFYTKSSSFIAMMASLILTILLFILNRLKIGNVFYYLLIGFFLWIAMVESGIHGTLSGVILSLAIPVYINDKINPSFHSLENILRPLVYFLIFPLFSFVNSGVSMGVFHLDLLKTNLALGIVLGLFAGKQSGIFFFSYLAVKKKWCTLPENVCWTKFYGIAALGGIGFTLSLFIGDLTFETNEPNYIMRISVIVGSLLSAICGTTILYVLFYKNKFFNHRISLK